MLAQVPALNDFVAGIKIVLAPGGVVTLEFPHLYQLMTGNQFDTIYHEHFSYFSFFPPKFFKSTNWKILMLKNYQLTGFIYGIFLHHANDQTHKVSDRVETLSQQEFKEWCKSIKNYSNFGENVKETKRKLLEFLITAKREGKK